MQVLLLNATYEPLKVISARRAVELLVTDKAHSVAEGDMVMRSPSIEVPVPVVARLVSMAKVPFVAKVGFSKNRLQVRDERSCQVSECDRRGDTIDHLVPRSRGGNTSWTNCVMMCERHNAAKGDRTLAELDWSLKKPARAPRSVMALAASRTPVPEWEPYLASLV